MMLYNCSCTFDNCCLNWDSVNKICVCGDMALDVRNYIVWVYALPISILNLLGDTLFLE